MSEMVRNERFLTWGEACRYVGDEGVLNETDELYFQYNGFASVEMGEKSYDRVHVNGFLRLYPADVKDLRSNMPVGCNSALVNGFMSINGSFTKELLEKFIVFDDELTIGVGSKSSSDNDLDYPSSIYFRESDLVKICDRFGLSPAGAETESVPHSKKLEREEELLRTVGALSCLLAKQKGVDYTKEWHHLSDSFIDELFDMLGSLGISTEGKSKFVFERLISEGVRYLNSRSKV
ncbi:MAG: hypothetical protein KZQ73_06650 [Candidatus Thiodiazotropha sp. (ex Semelilucina semeliformis)]|nr:hypothetical protein [Candidatus Thiodiazotropha sp. (ex Myrtea spinifera)]MCU7807533.1 hypothetical protein [Candidatus Thiodiazotropha sp. (ex Semelilucina semeliformis)]MCU7828293.1 hypothetical protein [Candidatus Thiodiazotropha sp. (ex Myrtea sp. 'scaly one' KF741663)]